MINQPGIGAMLHALSGGNPNDPAKYVNRIIIAAAMHDERLTLKFEDGTAIDIWDNGQSCCEHRHMTTDDDLNTLVGGRLVHITAKDGPDIETDYDVHEQVFVEVATNRGFITIVNHNEHNGYYGGFGLTITEHAHD